MTLKPNVFLILSILSTSSSGQRKISLNSDNKNINRKVKAQSDINNDSIQIYKNLYNTNDWVNAVVPGTVFTWYVNAGIEKDSNYGDNIYKVEKEIQ